MSENDRQVTRRRGPKQTPDAAPPRAGDDARGPKGPRSRVRSVRGAPSHDRKADAPQATKKAGLMDEAALSDILSMDSDAFAQAMAGAVGDQRSKHEAGDRVDGVIVGFTDRFALVDLGQKAEARIDREDVPEGKVVGDRVSAFVLDIGELGILLGTKLVGPQARDHLEQAAESGIPVEGKVVSRNAGGYQVQVAGTRAFCPVSHIALYPGTELDRFIGQTLQFRILEIKERDVVLSRKEIEKEERAERAKAFWKTIREGQVLDGTVRNVQPFGVFVELDGADGLLPKSELGEQDAAAYAIGRTVQVRVLRVDHDKRKITLCLPKRAKRQAPVGQPKMSLGTFADLFKQAKR
jgi:small subunit ribosomal protein S1